MLVLNSETYRTDSVWSVQRRGIFWTLHVVKRWTSKPSTNYETPNVLASSWMWGALLAEKPPGLPFTWEHSVAITFVAWANREGISTTLWLHCYYRRQRQLNEIVKVLNDFPLGWHKCSEITNLWTRLCASTRENASLDVQAVWFVPAFHSHRTFGKLSIAFHAHAVSNSINSKIRNAKSLDHIECFEIGADAAAFIHARERNKSANINVSAFEWNLPPACWMLLKKYL